MLCHIYGLTYNKHTLESLVLSSNIDEPFEWQIVTSLKGGTDVYFKSQNPYTYTEAKKYCKKGTLNRQGGLKSTEVGTDSSQLWTFNHTTETLINKGGIWESPKSVTWKMETKGKKEDNMVVLSCKYKNSKK